jgi:hypothetical protein
MITITEAAIKDKNGKIYTGKHHHLIFRKMPRELIKNSIQGFMTSEEKFVSRQEAAKIAFIAGQIPKLKWKLFSEDLD